MKFDLNKEFSFEQIFKYLKQKLTLSCAFIKKLDNSSIKNIKIKGRNVRINAVRLSLIAAVFAVLLAMLINLVIIPNTSYRAYSDLEFDTGGNYIVRPCGSNLMLLNKNGIKLVDNKGREKWSENMTLTNPSADTDGKYILLSDLDGNCSLRLYNINGKLLNTYPISTELLSAKVNEDGTAAAAVSEEGYKGSVVVYNRKAKEIFKWNSGEGYITDIDISPNGKLVAVARMMSDGDEAYSKITVINTASGNEVGGYVCDKQLVSKVNFSGSNIIAVGQSKIFSLTKRGKMNFEIDLAGKSPDRYDVENNGDMLVLCHDSRGSSVLEIYTRRGKIIGSFTSADEIKELSASQDTVVVSTSRNVMHINRRGKLKKTVEISHDIMNIGVYGNNRNVLVLGGNKADIIRVK